MKCFRRLIYPRVDLRERVYSHDVRNKKTRFYLNTGTGISINIMPVGKSVISIPFVFRTPGKRTGEIVFRRKGDKSITRVYRYNPRRF